MLVSPFQSKQIFTSSNTFSTNQKPAWHTSKPLTLFLDNVGQWAVPILVVGPLPWKVWINHQAFAVKSFYLPLLQKKVHILQLILLKTAGKSEILGITSMDPTSSLLMHPSHLHPPQKNWQAFVSASGLKCRLNPKAKLWQLHASYINHEYSMKTSTIEMYITFQFIQWEA